MNTEMFAELATRSQSGDKRALTQLLRLAHTPVSFQCRKLLRNEQAAETLTRQILTAVPKQLDSLSDPADFEKWICRITASRCMQALSRMHRDGVDETDRPANPPVIPAKHLDEDQTAQVVQQLVDDLPEEPRICLLLYSCAGLKLKGISQLTGFPESAVLDHLNHAQKAVNVQLRKYHRMGIQFAAIPALSQLLRTAMYNARNPKAAAAIVSDILVKKPAAPIAPPRKPSPGNKGLLIAVIAAAVLLLFMLISILFLERGRRQEPEVTTLPTVTETLLPAETTVETTPVQAADAAI